MGIGDEVQVVQGDSVPGPDIRSGDHHRFGPGDPGGVGDWGVGQFEQVVGFGYPILERRDRRGGLLDGVISPDLGRILPLAGAARRSTVRMRFGSSSGRFQLAAAPSRNRSCGWRRKV